MNRFESKYFNTAYLMQQALINLLNKKEYEYISIKEICSQAGVNRSTFYLHYETKDDLLKECIEETNKKFIDYFTKENKSFLEKLNSLDLNELYFITPEYLKPYLLFIKDNKNVFYASLNQPYLMEVNKKYSSLYKYIINPILNKFNVPEQEKEYMVYFYIKGILAIVDEWIKEGCKDNIDFIINIIMKCVQKPV